MENLTITGHPVNVSNFKILVQDLLDLGTSFNPKSERLQMAFIQTVSVNATDALTNLHNALQAYIKAVDEREAAYENVSALITRSFNALKVSDVDPKTIESAKTYVRKLQGKRAGKKLTEEELKALADEGKEIKQISASRMSYTFRFDNFEQFIFILANEPNYAPNEKDVQVASLNSHLEKLRTCNHNMATAESKLQDARINRNKVLYDPETGLVPIALKIKDYIKSIFGANSPEYKKIYSLSFRNFD